MDLRSCGVSSMPFQLLPGPRGQEQGVLNSPIHSLAHLFTHSFIHSLTHSLPYPSFHHLFEHLPSSNHSSRSEGIRRGGWRFFPHILFPQRYLLLLLCSWDSWKVRHWPNNHTHRWKDQELREQVRRQLAGVGLAMGEGVTADSSQEKWHLSWPQ